jgi:tRNA pseudouridine55 synthase
MDGVWVIDKPAGPTSFDVVKRVRTVLKEKKAGHTGTLDPMATGVLPVCVGEATKIAGFITDGDKAYDAVIRLGVETDTQDADGKVVAEAPVPALTRAQWEKTLDAFRGSFAQTPPMYSAVKVGGRRLYELARAGQEVERQARQVMVYALELKEIARAQLTISVRCSKGFFVRTLAHDIGRAVGCGAHLVALRRTASGPFTLSGAIAWSELDAEGGQANLRCRAVSIEDALADMPSLCVAEQDAQRVSHGMPLEVAVEGRLRVMGPGGQLLAVAEAERGRLRYLRVMGGRA